MRSLKTTFILLFILFPGVLLAHVADSVAVDSTTASRLIGEVSSETRALSDYFSLSKILISLTILAITYFFLRIVAILLSVWAERNTKRRVTIKGFIPIVRIVVWLGAMSFILVAVFRPPFASILAFSASIGVAIGFAAQDFLKNIFGGIIIIVDRPFQIGDMVQVGDYYGEVTGIGIRSTKIRTPDDNSVSVPNSEIMTKSVANANSGEENCQVVTELYLPLEVDVEQVREMALEAAQVSKHVFLNKPIVVLFSQVNIGYKIMLKIKVKAYVNDIRNEFAFKSELTELLTKEFNRYYKAQPIVAVPGFEKGR